MKKFTELKKGALIVSLIHRTTDDCIADAKNRKRTARTVLFCTPKDWTKNTARPKKSRAFKPQPLFP